ncbi:MAG: nucleotidyltransferase family protein [Sphingomicrobium sp.]
MRTAEFQLAVRSCRLAFDPAFAASSDHPNLDWQRFYRLAQFHRVQGLVWKSLPRLGSPVPGEVARKIADDAARIAAQNRESLAECGTLADALHGSGIDFLFLKGLPLGMLAYGSPWLKAAVDLDLLIDEARLDDAVAVLRSCGFRREDGRPEDIGALRAWHRLRKDSEWGKPGSTARVDLHTRLTDNPALIPTVGIGSLRQSVKVTPGCQLPTLSTDDLFAHLCVHGASSAWFRLKWITDLAALLQPRTSNEIARLYRRSQELGAGRAAGQALLLADSLYGTLDDCPDLRDRLNADGYTCWLCRAALRQLAGRPEPVEPTARPGGTLRIHLTQFLLLPGMAFKASEFIRQARATAAA